MALRAACRTLLARDDVNHDSAIVLAAVGARAVALAELPALLARGGAGRLKRVVRAPLSGLGSVATHSYYHNDGIIPIFRPFATRQLLHARGQSP